MKGKASTTSQRYRATRPHLLMIEISFPDDNVTRSGRIGFILGVWLPLVLIILYQGTRLDVMYIIVLHNKY